MQTVAISRPAVASRIQVREASCPVKVPATAPIDTVISEPLWLQESRGLGRGPARVVGGDAVVLVEGVRGIRGGDIRPGSADRTSPRRRSGDRR